MLEGLRSIRGPRQRELGDAGRACSWAPGMDRLDPNLSTAYPGYAGGRSTGTFDPVAQGEAGE